MLLAAEPGPSKDEDSSVSLNPLQHFFHRYPHLREFACGGTAAAINIVVTFPPNKIMFRQQVQFPCRV